MEQTEKRSGCAAPEEHHHTMELARLDMPAAETMQELAEQFRLFGDVTRVRILWVLSQGAMCVCDLAELLQCGTVGSVTSAAPAAAGRTCAV